MLAWLSKIVFYKQRVRDLAHGVEMGEPFKTFGQRVPVPKVQLHMFLEQTLLVPIKILRVLLY